MKILNEMTGQEMFFLLAGPCVIEGEEMALKIAEHVSELTDKWGIPYVFKGSFKNIGEDPERFSNTGGDGYS